MDNIKMGKYFKELRNEKNLTQADVVSFFKQNDITISENAISLWENGEAIPTYDNLELLSKLYNKTIDELLDGESIVSNFEDKYYLHINVSSSPYEVFYGHKYTQAEAISVRFNELLKIRIERFFSHNEEAEFNYLFNHYYLLSEYAEDYISVDTVENDIRALNSIQNLLIKKKELSNDEKYWELSKLFREVGLIRFNYWYLDLLPTNKSVLDRFISLPDWQKDMILATFQNVDMIDYDPSKLTSNALKKYEDKYGIFDREKYIKDRLKMVIKNGAYINKYFLNYKKEKETEICIIDRLDILYETYFKPIEIRKMDDDNISYYLVENNKKNRFLNEYYFDMLRIYYPDISISDKDYSKVDELYDIFINNKTLPKSDYIRFAKNKGIDTNRDEKYWIADLEFHMRVEINSYNNIQKKEKMIEDMYNEMKMLSKLLLNGKTKTVLKRFVELGGKTAKEIRDYIEYWRLDLSYKEFLDNRDIKKTKELLKDIDNLSVDEIREKYFKVEVIE